MPEYDAMIRRPGDGEPDPLVPQPSGVPKTGKPLRKRAKKTGKPAKAGKKGTKHGKS